jgi:hypothetical protein
MLVTLLTYKGECRSFSVEILLAFTIYTFFSELMPKSFT